MGAAATENGCGSHGEWVQQLMKTAAAANENRCGSHFSGNTEEADRGRMGAAKKGF